MNWWKNQGLNFKVAVGLAIPLVIVLGLSFFGLSQYIRARLWQSEIEKAENVNAIASLLIKDAMVAGKPDSIHQALGDLGNTIGNQRLNSIAVYNEHSELYAFATGFKNGVVIPRDEMPTSVQDPTCWGCHQLPAQQRPRQLDITVGGQKVIRSSVPLYNETRCQLCHGTETRILGDVMVDYSQSGLLEAYTNILFGMLTGLIGVVALAMFVLYLVIGRIVIQPVTGMAQMAEAMSRGSLNQQIQVSSNDEIGKLAHAFNSMTKQVRELVGNLEERVIARTAELQAASQQSEKRARDLQTISEISRAISSQQKLEDLLPQVVDLVSQRFGFYHVGIFLLDSVSNTAVLRAANSPGGKRMLERGHRLEIGQVGIVGKVAATAMPRIAMNVGEDAAYFNNPDLPETRSEIALPMKISGVIIGVLDVQSTEQTAFTTEDISSLSILADQISVAIENARLYEDARKSAEQSEAAFRQYVKNQWRRFAREERLAGYRYAAGASEELDSPLELEAASEALQDGSIHQADADADGRPAQLGIPIKLRGEVIGVLHIATRKKSRWSDDDVDIAEAVADRLALALENARLFRSSANRAARERIVSEISSRISGNIRIKNILQTAAQELSQALNGSEVLIQLQPPSQTRGNGSKQTQEQVHG